MICFNVILKKLHANKRKKKVPYGPKAQTDLFMFLSPKGSLVVYIGIMHTQSKYASLTDLTITVPPPKKKTFYNGTLNLANIHFTQRDFQNSWV